MTARVRYTPKRGATPEPRIPHLFAVRYVRASNGETVTQYRQRRADALALAREIRQRGGEPRIFVGRVAGWTKQEVERW